MNFIFKFFFICLISCAMCACDNTTDMLGIDVIPSTDKTSTTDSIYSVFSKTIKVDSLASNTSQCFLGQVTDPETNVTTTCSFMTQFYIYEDYNFPVTSPSSINENIEIDSVVVNLFINSYYGDSLNSFKIGIYELSKEKIITEGKTYYTNLNIEDYISKEPDAINKEVVASVIDLSVDDSIRFDSKYSKNIKIKLPNELGNKILKLYEQHPEYFQDSYSFIHNILPGFYFKFIHGNGIMINIDVTTLALYFNYKIDNQKYSGILATASTEEVLQNNVVNTLNIENLLKEDTLTYIKSPVGAFTEVTLPIDSIFINHETDSINSAKIVFKRLNNVSSSEYQIPVPSQLMMVRKSEATHFFEKHKAPDNKTSYVTTFSEANNSYTYTNIANLITNIYREIKEKAGIQPTDTKDAIQSKLDRWITDNPNWKDEYATVILMPVITERSTTGAYAIAYNDLSLSSTKLVGGKKNDLKIEIVYSNFAK